MVGGGLRNTKQGFQIVDKFFLRIMVTNLLREKTNVSGKKDFKLARKNKVLRKERGRNRKNKNQTKTSSQYTRTSVKCINQRKNRGHQTGIQQAGNSRVFLESGKKDKKQNSAK